MAEADTIAAVATPFGEGAVSLIRLSGPGALEIADRVCKGRPPSRFPARRQTLAEVRDARGARVDEALVSVHRGPASYTGEDVVEIGCHGGILITRRVLEAVVEAGARLAGPGEFTQRAFLNGKLDLTQAEGVMDLIRAQTDLALRAASEQLEGTLGRRFQALREDLLGLAAHIEAYIDFPDEDIDPDTGASLLARFDAALAAIEALLATAGQGRLLREGVRTVIYGEPNVGKSSLLNALLGIERAIVSPTPGTTRDTIEEFINVRGLPLRLVDTAGLRESADAIENAGMERTRQSIDRADLTLRVLDASQSAPAERLPRAAEILVLNKADVGVHQDWIGAENAVRISCTEGTGIDALAEEIYRRVTSGQVAWNDAAPAINTRHQASLRQAHDYLYMARCELHAGVSPDIVAMDLRTALDAIAETIGGTGAEEILTRIFATFCIGK